jgi:hypothetical protein
MAHGPDTDELLRRIRECNNRFLYLSTLNITSIPSLPPTLTDLVCTKLLIKELPSLPATLRYLDCSYTTITELPPLPDTLEALICNNTNLTQLPPLPVSLRFLMSFSCPKLIIQHIPGRISMEENIKRWRDWHSGETRCRERCAAIKEELMAAAWYPRRVEKWINEYGIEILDSL